VPVPFLKHPGDISLVLVRWQLTLFNGLFEVGDISLAAFSSTGALLWHPDDSTGLEGLMHSYSLWTPWFLPLGVNQRILVAQRDPASSTDSDK